jgi:hypothetical protein
VPYLKRKIAVTTVVTHTIEHEGDVLKLEVRPSLYMGFTHLQRGEAHAHPYASMGARLSFPLPLLVLLLLFTRLPPQPPVPNLPPLSPNFNAADTKPAPLSLFRLISIQHTTLHPTQLKKKQVQPLNMKTTFNIDGAPSISYIGKKAFEDRMTWNDRGELVLVKSNAEDGTEITAVRALSDDGRTLVMVRAVRVGCVGWLVAAGRAWDGGVCLVSRLWFVTR